MGSLVISQVCIQVNDRSIYELPQNTATPSQKLIFEQKYCDIWRVVCVTDPNASIGHRP